MLWLTTDKSDVRDLQMLLFPMLLWNPAKIFTVLIKMQYLKTYAFVEPTILFEYKTFIVQKHTVYLKKKSV